jgi:hypothetical protein
VNILARLSLLGIQPICRIFAATDSWTHWYAIELCFFLSVDSGTVELPMSVSLSQSVKQGVSIGIPIIRSLYCNEIINSTAI